MLFVVTIDLLHKSHSAPLPYTTIHHFVTEIGACAHICYKLVHCGIFVWCIVWFVRWVYTRHQYTRLTLTHWGRVTHICVNDLTSIGSDNGLSPGRRQAIIRTNAGILLIRHWGTNFSEFLVEILIFSFKKMRLKVSSAKRRPFCLGLNELTVRPNIVY